MLALPEIPANEKITVFDFDKCSRHPTLPGLVRGCNILCCSGISQSVVFTHAAVDDAVPTHVYFLNVTPDSLTWAQWLAAVGPRTIEKVSLDPTCPFANRLQQNQEAHPKMLRVGAETARHMAQRRSGFVKPYFRAKNKFINRCMKNSYSVHEMVEGKFAAINQARIAAEQGRVAAEQARTAAEEGRVAADQARATADQGRDEAKIAMQNAVNMLNLSKEELKQVQGELKEVQGERDKFAAELKTANEQSQKATAKILELEGTIKEMQQQNTAKVSGLEDKIKEMKTQISNFEERLDERMKAAVNAAIAPLQQRNIELSRQIEILQKIGVEQKREQKDRSPGGSESGEDPASDEAHGTSPPRSEDSDGVPGAVEFDADEAAALLHDLHD